MVMAEFPGTSRNDMNDGTVWYAWIDVMYNGTNLELRLSETNNSRPLFLSHEHVSIMRYLKTNSAYIGFTAGTGGDYKPTVIFSA